MTESRYSVVLPFAVALALVGPLAGCSGGAGAAGPSDTAADEGTEDGGDASGVDADDASAPDGEGDDAVADIAEDASDAEDVGDDVADAEDPDVPDMADANTADADAADAPDVSTDAGDTERGDTEDASVDASDAAADVPTDAGDAADTADAPGDADVTDAADVSDAEDAVADATDGADDIEPDVDVCEARPSCALGEPTICTSTAVVVCEEDLDGCFVPTPYDCARSGAVCVTTPAGPTCDEARCGDGVRDASGREACDDGDTDDGDGCDRDCQIETDWVCDPESSPSDCNRVVCGDGRVDASGGEVCDGSGPGCTDCSVDAGWACLGSPSVCTECGSECPIEIGDRGESAPTATGSIDDTDEQWARRSATCAADGGPDYYFDAIPYVNLTGRDQLVTVTASWASGDGYLHAYEGVFNEDEPGIGCIQGDDDFGSPPAGGSRLVDILVRAGGRMTIVASTFSADAPIGGYTIEVESEVGCGDGVIESLLDEVCDDDNAESGDGCSDTCFVELGYICTGQPSTCRAKRCGDGTIDAPEACDDGNEMSGDGCSPICRIEPGFLCDDGATSTCLEVVCGDGRIDVEGGETCDAGEAVTEGCTDACGIRAGWACEGEPSSCREITCGDGFVDGAEECDDGDTDDGDGCSSTCRAEAEAVCWGLETLVCTTPICGNGSVDFTEGCDPPAAGSCNADCLLELPAPGGSVEVSGSIDASDPTFERPIDSCLASASEGYFDAWYVANDTGVDVQLTATASWSADGYLFLHEAGFDPFAAAGSCLIGNDDFGGAAASQFSFRVRVGERAVIVATSWSALEEIGDYTLTLTTAIP